MLNWLWHPHHPLSFLRSSSLESGSAMMSRSLTWASRWAFSFLFNAVYAPEYYHQLGASWPRWTSQLPENYLMISNKQSLCQFAVALISPIKHFSFQDYLAVKEKYAEFLPHFLGSFQEKRISRHVGQKCTDFLFMFATVKLIFKNLNSNFRPNIRSCLILARWKTRECASFLSSSLVACRSPGLLMTPSLLHRMPPMWFV